MSVQNPHDRFFRESFGRQEIARDFLKHYLPAELRTLINLRHLQLEDGSFLDEAMQAHQSDLLYSTRLASGASINVYFLFEHKSYPDGRVALQLLRYMLRIWERQEKEQVALTPIIPLVIYHGEKAWPFPTTFGNLLDSPDEFRPYLPDFRYHLSDFSHLSDETIRGGIWLRVSLAVLRAVFDPRLTEQLGDLIDLVFQLSRQRTGLEYIRTILYYLSSATEIVKPVDLQQAILDRGRQGEKVMTTLAQEWIKEGIEQGITQGRQEAKREIARELLKRFDAATVSEITGLSLDELRTLKSESDDN